MLALGTLLFCAATLFFTVMVLTIRHPRAARWTRSDTLHSLICTTAAGLCVGGLASILKGLIDTPLAEQPFGLAETAAMVVVTAVILWRLAPLRRLRAYEAGAVTPDALGATLPTLPTGGQPA